MNGDAPASSRTLPAIALAIVVVAAVAISVYAAIADRSEGTALASTYSRSVIGHAGMLALLRARGIDATVSRGAPLGKPQRGGVLVVAEPDFDPGSGDALKTLLRNRNVLLVLPKWTGGTDRADRSWLAAVYPKPLAIVQSVLDDTPGGLHVVRGSGGFQAKRNEFAAPAHVDSLPQSLAPSDRLRALVADADGKSLIAGMQTARGKLWILADPDIINDYGLGHGNAALAMALFERARQGGPVVFDETMHGFATAPNGSFRLLIARPFRAATIDGLLAVALLIWATWAEFGARLPRPAPLPAGKQPLIANIADLLVYAGHQGELALRYVQVTVEDVAATLHAPGGDHAARAAWLAQIQAQRGSKFDSLALHAEAATLATSRHAPSAAVFAVAEKIHRWKQDMLHGA